jgi:hypothetical protein
MFVSEQFQPVVQCTYGTEQIMAQARAQQAGEIGRANGQRLSSTLRNVWRSTQRAASSTSAAT